MTTRNIPPEEGLPAAADPTQQVPGNIQADQPLQVTPIAANVTPPEPWVTPPAVVPVPPAAIVASEPTQVYAVPPPPPPPVDQAPIYPPGSRGPGPLPWIIGGVAALALLGLLVLFLTNRKPPTASPTPVAVLTTATDTPIQVPSSTPFQQVVTVTQIVTQTVLPPSDTPAPPSDTPVPGLATVTPLPPTAIPPTSPPAQATTPALRTTPVPTTPAPVTTPKPTDTAGAQGSPGPTGTAGGATPQPTAVGPSGPADVAPAPSREGYLTVQWFGQSCFLLAAGEGTRILLDPVGPDFGYHLPFFDKLNALLVTHLHTDHTYTQVVPGGVPNLVGLGSDGHFQAISRQFGAVAVRDVASFHDDNQGRDRGENAMWVIDVDGFHVVHLGDLGQTQLTDQQLGDIGTPDILMIPVGGGGQTIDGQQAQAIIAQLKPKLVIPMLYRTDRTPANPPLETLDKFLNGQPPANPPNVLRLKKSDLPAQPSVQVMNYK